MFYFAAILLAALLVAGGTTLVVTISQLPARVATHFDVAGFANGFMSREGYLLFMLALTLGVPLLVAVLTAVLPRLVPNAVRIPARDYWLAPERRAEALATIATVGLIMACVVAAFMIALHLLLVEANSRTPPRLDTAILLALVAILIVAMLAAQLFRWRRFKVPQ